MRSNYVLAIGMGLVVGLIAGCKEPEPAPVTMAPAQSPAPYPEPPVTTLAPAPEANTADTYAPVDTTPIPGEERPAARSGSHTPRSGNTGRAATPRSNYAPASPKSGRSYTVKKGDTLQEISQKYYGTTRQWRKIYNANRGRIKGGPEKIVPGMKLTIPPK